MRKIKILQVESYYKQHLINHYQKNDNFRNKSYHQLWQELMFECNGGIGDAWKDTFESFESYEYEIVVIDDEILQKQWALENDFKFNENKWRIEIFFRQLEIYRPDILFLHHMDSIDVNTRHYLRTNYLFIKVFMTWDGIGICDAKRVEGFDLVLSCMKYVRDFYLNIGINAQYIPLAFDNRVNQRIIEGGEKSGKLTFVGGIALFNNGHFKRLHLLSELANTIPVDFFILGIHGFKRILISEIRCLLRGDIKGMQGIMSLNKMAKQPVFGIDMFQVLHNSSVTLNIHIDAAKNEAANMRLFEATGVGSCLLTDWKQNLEDFFVLEKEVASYKSFEECIEKSKWLVENPMIANEIGENGQKRTLSEHNYLNRLKPLSENLNEILKK